MKQRVSPQELAAYLKASGTVRQHFSYVASGDIGLPPRPRYLLTGASAEELANQLLAETELAGLRLGTWLGTPEGELIDHAVRLVIPPAYRDDHDLLVEALQLAARRQQPQMAALALGGLTLLGAVILWSTRKR